MKKTVIKTCSCFVDKAVWFVNLSQKRIVNPWRFDCVISESRLVDIIENKFIKDIRSKKIIVDEKICFKDTILFRVLIVSSFSSFYSRLKRIVSLIHWIADLLLQIVLLMMMITAVIYLLEILSLCMRTTSIRVNREKLYLETMMLD